MRAAPPGTGAHEAHGLVAVGPGFAGSMLVAGGYAMNPLPVQPAKIHCPPERSDTLTRERLNSWLERASAGRLGLIVAEAGFGKTTLLADWARHTRRRTAWYRLEPDDRDWLTFIRHLVASGRELDPGFAPETFSMLVALGGGGPTQRDLTVSIAREMAELGAATERGLTLILDDYHLVDGFHETEPIVRALLDRTGPGFSVVIASRSMPTLPLGRLRTRGAVLTLRSRDLRFDESETSSLFRDAYRCPLPDDVASDLCGGTEGWAALLSLIRAGIGDKTDPRHFVMQLSASQGEIYDYLAEEVLAALPEDLTRFLTRVSILTVIEPVAAAIVAGRSVEETAKAIGLAERLGLMSRPDHGAAHAFHPLVRAHLAARFEVEVGKQKVRDLHRTVARDLPAAAWNIRAWHLLQAGDRDACQSVVDEALDQIIASGDFDYVKPFLDVEAGDPQRPEVLVLKSKMDLVRGDFDRAAHWARVAVDRSEHSGIRAMCLLNLAATLSVCGIADEARAINEKALALPLSRMQRYVVQGNLGLLDASLDGDLQEIAESFGELANEQQRSGLARYAGISRLNRAIVLVWIGDASAALQEGIQAELMLGGRARESLERVAATTIAAVSLAQLGQLDEARAFLDTATIAASSLSLAELSLETARIEVEFGSRARAAAALGRFDPTQHSRSHQGLYHLIAGELALRDGRLAAAKASVDDLASTRCADVAGQLRAAILATRVALAAGTPDALGLAEQAARLAVSQNSPRARYLTRLLVSIAAGEALDLAVNQGRDAETYCWSLIAEELSSRLHLLRDEARSRVMGEAQRRSERWSTALRMAIDSDGEGAVAAAQLLSSVGDDDDATWLRKKAAVRKDLRPHALLLIQRVSKPVLIEDLGVVSLRIGSGEPPRSLRRKVLALICYLASRPRMAASREEATEALWPDLAPEAGSNSLHQALYSLRRVLEPDFREGLSADYVHFDGDIVSLNQDLVDSSSRLCWRLLGQVRAGSGTAFDELIALYTGKFALTFAYDDWAETYRENLHAAVLAAAESEMSTARRQGDFDRAIRIGHEVLSVDPQADPIELELLRAYKQSGRHAAAAEQYTHYASYVRQELAAEPPSWDDV